MFTIILLVAINPLTSYDLHMHHAVSPLNSQMIYIYIANCLLKFGAILFTPIRLTAMACNASGPLKVWLSYRHQNVPPPPPKAPHRHRYIHRHFITAHFSQLTNTVLTLLAMVIACSAVHCGLKYRHWPMKQNLFLDQTGWWRWQQVVDYKPSDRLKEGTQIFILLSVQQKV